MAGSLKRKHPKRILDYCREWDIAPHHNKGKTCTQGILRYIRNVQVYALNMIEPPCTERYARWCERSATQLMGSILLEWLYFYSHFFYARKPLNIRMMRQ